MDRMGGPPAMGCHQPLNPISWFSLDLSKAQKRATVSEKNKSSLEKRKYQTDYGDGKPFSGPLQQLFQHLIPKRQLVRQVPGNRSLGAIL